jgi:hypothetical protein
MTDALYLVYCVQRFYTFGDLAQDAINRSTPDEHLGLLVVNVILDSGHQFLDSVKAAASDALLGQIAKPTFDQVQPRAGCRNEMQVEARMTFQLGFHARVFVGRVVIDNQMQF